MNTYTSVYAWPSQLLCPSLKNWWHKKGVTFHTDVDRSSFVHSSNILRGFIAFFFLHKIIFIILLSLLVTYLFSLAVGIYIFDGSAGLLLDR